MKKPSIKDFDSPGISSELLTKELEETKPKEKNAFLFGVIISIVFAIITSVIIWGTSNDELIWGIIGIFFLSVLPISFSYEHLAKPKLNPVNESRIIELKNLIRKRKSYENALSQWEYYNLVSNKGYWLNKKGIDLENALQQLLESKGWHVKTTKIVGDAGIDLICTRLERQILIQCKGHKSTLGVSSIRDAAGVMMADKPDAMIVVSPNGFTKGSIDFAKKSGVGLIDAEYLTNIAKDKKDLISTPF